MKKSLVGAVQRAVRFGFEQLVPELSISSEVLPTALALYHADLIDGLRAYVMFQVHRRQDSFTIEVACTKKGRWPAYYLRRPEALDELSDGDVRFRLARFWGAEDYWWPVTPESVNEAVSDALKRLRLYALPYFQTMTQKKA